MAMASTACGHGMGVAILCFVMLVVPLEGAGNQVGVGGSMGWAVPTDPNVAWYNKWASRMRFRIGDSLLFVYPSGEDSVLVVTKEDYETCNGASPLARFDDGNSVYTFDHSGPHYFISGVEDNCHKNEKMVVVVIADRSKPSPSMPPPPPPPPSSTPPPPPISSTSPPSPSEGPPMPPPPGEGSNTPNPPPPSMNADAPLKSMSEMSIMGAILGMFMFAF